MLDSFSPQTSSVVLASVADYFKVLSEVSRLQILSCLQLGAMNGKEIAEATGLGQANLSKHLKALTQSGIISRQPQGVSVYYQITDPVIYDLCKVVCDRISQQMRRRLTRSEAAKLKGVSVSTLRRWESEGKLIPERTANGHRRYTVSQLLGVKENLSYTVGYCRVSSHDQKKDLERQKEVVELFCA